MRRDRSSDMQTFSLFVILGLLTILLVFGAKWILFDPSLRPGASSGVDTTIEATKRP